MKKIILLSACLLSTLCIQAQTQNALNFDGSNDFVQTTFSGVLGSANRTFEAWIFLNQNAPTSNLCILDYGNNTGGSRNTFAINGSRGLTYLAGGTNGNISSTAGVVPTNQWVHVAFVLNNGIGSFYLNGSEVGTGNLSGVDTPSATNLRIGQRVPGGSIPFNGAIDEVRIWNIALTPNEITANMGTEICTSSTNLTAYYQFNEGTANSSNAGIITLPELVLGNNGILNNFTLSGATSNWTAGTPINSFPVIDTSINENAGIITASQSGATYQWIDCSNSTAINGATSSTFAPTVIGNYAVEITLNGCTEVSACVNVNTLGLSNNILNKLSITKNPSQFLNFNGATINNAQVSIRTLSGKELLISTIDELQTINPSIATGLYIVTVSQDGASKTFKWIKE